MNAPLRKGSEGSLVESIQNFLTGKGYNVGSADGRFGEQTRQGVIGWQRKNGLLADGVIGNVTLATMIEAGLAILQPVATSGFPQKPDFKPLSGNSERFDMFGHYKYRSAPVKGNAENIEILGDWEDENIVRVEIPELKEMGFDADGVIRFHKMAADQLKALWKSWGEADLLKYVLTYDGGFVPRFVRGSRTNLSNHAFGTAFDINAEWNGLGVQPARSGQKGCVYPLVQIANDLGFYWGGHFSRLDGMHFELAIDLKIGEGGV